MYRLSDIAMITGLTERTLRTYLKFGILKGKKEGRAWCFDIDELTAFLEHETVKSAMRSNRNTLVFDFLNDSFADEDTACVILHLEKGKRQATAKFFCEAVNKREGVRMRFDTLRGTNQVILLGKVETVDEIVDEYQNLEE